MFHTAKVTRDPAGVPTGLASIVQVGIAAAVIQKVAGIASPDDLIIAETMVEKVGLELVTPLSAAAVQKKMDTGAWGIPFMKTA